MYKTAIKLVVLLLGIGLAAGCGGPGEDKLAQIHKAGRLILGTSGDYPPYEFHKNVGGQDSIVGFDVAIAKEIAADLGVQLEIRDMRFDGLLAALASGNVDLVLAGMTPDEDRKKNVDFSTIYYSAVQGVLVRAADQNKYKTMTDLKGLKVGAQKGAIQEKIAKEQIPDVKITALGKISDLALELKNRKVDALIVEYPVAHAYLSKNKDLALAPAQPQESVGGSAVAIKKGNVTLVHAVDKTIGRLVAANKIDAFVAEATDMVE